MADGNGSPAPSVWSTDFRRVFREVEGKPVFGMLVAADNKRSEEREERRCNNRGQIIPLTVITALLTTTLCIIRDVDRPFGGIIDVRPTAITEAERQATRDFLTRHTPADLPCDDQGNRRTV
ncbi:hypothetical protein [Streptomyces sp. NPDC050507]|uniref:hypothetical protein n=1 Tax=unclassified Streptomyces TaxID=2593676 RepID=UPI003250A8A1